MALNLVFISSLLAGCGQRLTLEQDDLTDRIACVDLLVAAYDEGSTHSVTMIFLTDVVAQTIAAGEVTEWEFTLPTNDVDATVEVGAFLSDGTCDDVIMNEPMVERTFVAVEGSILLTVDARGVDHPEDGGSEISVRLNDAVFTDADGQAEIQSFETGELQVLGLAG